MTIEGEAMQTTIDAFFDGRVQLYQRRNGFRSGFDAVLMAAAVPAQAGDHILDIGCGCGVGGILCAYRVRDVAVIGVDIDPDMITLAGKNGTHNGIDFKAVAGDVCSGSAIFAPDHFDQVMANPPYFTDHAGRQSGDVSKDRARHAPRAALGEWMALVRRCLKPKGTVVIVHTTERLPDLLAELAKGFGAISLIPIWTVPGRSAKRMIVTAVKGSRAPLRLTPGVLLEDETGQQTKLAKKLLRDGEALRL